MMKLISTIGLAAGLFIVSSSLTQAQQDSTTPAIPGDTSTPVDNYDTVDNQCTFFDKIVFSVGGTRYDKKYLYDIIVIQNKIRDLTNLTQAVLDYCKFKDPTQYTACGYVKTGDFKIEDVDFAVACNLQNPSTPTTPTTPPTPTTPTTPPTPTTPTTPPTPTTP